MIAKAKTSFSSFHRRFGTAGVVISVIALVFALAGGAFAATGGLTAKQKKQVKAIAKSYQGTGPTGAAGPAGAQGAQGPAGNNGAPGTNGTNGTDGTNGTNGKTVLSGAAPPDDVDGTDGDFYIDTSVSDLYGPKGCTTPGSWSGCGPTSLQGSPWTAGGTLPTGATEVGTWGGTSAGLGRMNDGQTDGATISFNIPVVPGPSFVYVPPDASGFFGTDAANGCPGVSAGLPQAASGTLCVYARTAGGTDDPPADVGGIPLAASADPAGKALDLSCISPVTGKCWAWGVWAVTG